MLHILMLLPRYFSFSDISAFAASAYAMFVALMHDVYYFYAAVTAYYFDAPRLCRYGATVLFLAAAAISPPFSPADSACCRYYCASATAGYRRFMLTLIFAAAAAGAITPLDMMLMPDTRSATAAFAATAALRYACCPLRCLLLILMLPPLPLMPGH